MNKSNQRLEPSPSQRAKTVRHLLCFESIPSLVNSYGISMGFTGVVCKQLINRDNNNNNNKKTHTHIYI